MVASQFLDSAMKAPDPAGDLDRMLMNLTQASAAAELLMQRG